MKKAAAVLGILVALCATPAGAEQQDKRAEKRAKIDAVAEEALQGLFEQSETAKSLYDKAYGYAVFDNLKIALMVSGGGGTGVAVDKSSEKRTYMKMGTVGVNIGLGGQKYQVVFLFENEKVFNDFVDKGWQADAQASAAAGTASAEVATNFNNGLAIYQMTEAGLMASADVSGTKYWKNKKLND